MKEYSISKFTIDRLPMYFRELRRCQMEGCEIISSQILGCRVGVKAEQVRKDLATFGDFGKKGVGYIVDDLLANIKNILGLNRKWNIAIVGAGHLGRALANNLRFDSINYNLVAIFDVDHNKIGKHIKNVEINSLDMLEALVLQLSIDIAAITTPNFAAQTVADRLIAGGIGGIWNFAPVNLKVPDNMPVESEDLSSGLVNLTYHLANDSLSGENNILGFYETVNG